MLYSYNVTASDVDGDALDFVGTTIPGWLTLSDNGDGTALLSGTPSSVGVDSVEITVHERHDTLIYEDFESYSNGYDYVSNNASNWWNNGGSSMPATVNDVGNGSGGSDSYLVSGDGWNKLQYSFIPTEGFTYQLKFEGALTAYYANNLKIQVIQLNDAGDADDSTRQELSLIHI